MWGPTLGSKNRNTTVFSDDEDVATEQDVWKCLEV